MQYKYALLAIFIFMFLQQKLSSLLMPEFCGFDTVSETYLCESLDFDTLLKSAT